MTQARVLQFGKRVRELRLAQNITQEQLADYAELDRSYMGQVERGEKNITLKNMFKIADALKVKPHELFIKSK